MGLFNKKSKIPESLIEIAPGVMGPRVSTATYQELIDMGFPGVSGYSHKKKRWVDNPGVADIDFENMRINGGTGGKSGRRGKRSVGDDGGRYQGQGDPRRRLIDSGPRDHIPFGPGPSHHSIGGGDAFDGPGPSNHPMGGFNPFDPPPMSSHHSMGGGNPFGFDHPPKSSHHSMGGGGFNPFDQPPPDFGPQGGTSSHHSAFDPFDNQPPFLNQNFDDEPPFPPNNNNNFGGPTAPQFRSNAHPGSSSARGHASLPAPRPGKIREGDPLPTGMFDPLKSSSAAVPKGHHGLREHKPGMTNLHVSKGTSAENPAGKWEFLDELMRTDRNGGGSKRDGGGRSKREGGGASRYTHSAR
jgi:hypothetical protein